ncbi:MAG: carbohydrate ABC transporter permease [Candidatus Nealsonbacteria bacterium]|nr:MAG: carbohydrate ABC transporter permease [Candidatus Nealsonbacteria bacterium]
MSLPFIFMISTSLKTDQQLLNEPSVWIPNPIEWKNYVQAWTGYLPFSLFLKNTLIIALSCVAGVVLCSSFVAFSFARLRWYGRDFWFIMVLSTIMIPFYARMIPQYLLFKRFGWINTFYPLIVPWWLGGGPFNVFLLRQFFMTIPLEYDDAARIDGCSSFGIYWRIILPMSKPALTAIAIIHFVFQWKTFIEPLIFLNDQSKYTLSLGLMLFQQAEEVYWNHLMAACVLVSLPPLILFFLFQRYFIQGVVVSGMKG